MIEWIPARYKYLWEGPPSPFLYSPLKVHDTADNDSLFIAVEICRPIELPGVPFCASLSDTNCSARVGGVSRIKRFPVHSTSIYKNDIKWK